MSTNLLNLNNYVLARQCTFSPPEESCIENTALTALVPGTLGTVTSGALTLAAGVLDAGSTVQKSGRTGILYLDFSILVPVVGASTIMTIVDPSLLPAVTSLVTIHLVTTGVVLPAAFLLSYPGVITPAGLVTQSLGLPAAGTYQGTVTYFTAV